MLTRPAIPGTLNAATRAAELSRLRRKLDAVELEQYLERRQLDRQLARLGVNVKATPRPRPRSAPSPSNQDLPEIYRDPATRRAQAFAASHRALFRPAIGYILDVK